MTIHRWCEGKIRIHGSRFMKGRQMMKGRHDTRVKGRTRESKGRTRVKGGTEEQPTLTMQWASLELPLTTPLRPNDSKNPSSESRDMILRPLRHKGTQKKRISGIGGKRMRMER
jgi:hypothetical protein